MSSFLEQIRSQKGSIVLPIIGIGILGGFIFLVMNIQKLMLNSIKYAEESLEFQIEYYSAADTLYYAYKQEEIKYLKALSASSCNTIRPFVEALKKGSGCPSTIKVFKQDPAVEAFYKFHDGCKITQYDSGCKDSTPHILSIKSSLPGNGINNPFSRYDFDFYIFGITPEKSLIEFLVVTTDITGQKRILGDKRKRTLALVDNVRNIAHIEADGRVSDENPSPLNRCQGESWGELKSFNPVSLACETFKQIGGAEGLAFYKGRFFGFNPASGQIYDLLSTITGGNSALPQNGVINGTRVFPKYSKTLLANTNDITVIEDTVYYVAGNGGNSHIGFIDMQFPASRKLVCNVGVMGWGQSYEGILATSRSQDIKDMTKVGNSATFYLKSSGGDLLTFIVTINAAQQYDCIGIKDYNLQQIEYNRTFGFDRTEDGASLYYY